VDGKDVRVLKRGRDVNLAKEPLGTEPDPQLRADHLDGDIAAMLEIAGMVDHRQCDTQPVQLIHGEA